MNVFKNSTKEKGLAENRRRFHDKGVLYIENSRRIQTSSFYQSVVLSRMQETNRVHKKTVDTCVTCCFRKEEPWSDYLAICLKDFAMLVSRPLDHSTSDNKPSVLFNL